MSDQTMSRLREALDYWRETDFQAKAASGGLELGGDQVLDMGRFYAAAHRFLALTETIEDAEKMVAVTLRREFPDILPTTDAWRPISQRACELIAQRVLADYLTEEET